ncbi:hypothetical protein PINS_up005983 [Pythium insidiosum]|nr:hypothetical protein PINS_up005983 [Pythium insidiosum]
MKNNIVGAAWNEDFDGVKEMLDRGVNVNPATSLPDTTALHQAAFKGNLVLVRLLLAHGADIHPHDWEDGDTALHMAAYQGHHDVVKLLLDSGADVNCQNDLNHRTPLHGAAYLGHVDVVRLLLTRGADVFAVDSRTGETPLHVAASTGQVDAIRLLVEAGANINETDKNGRSVFGSLFGTSFFHTEVPRLFSSAATLVELNVPVDGAAMDILHQVQSAEVEAEMKACLARWQCERDQGKRLTGVSVLVPEPPGVRPRSLSI